MLTHRPASSNAPGFHFPAACKQCVAEARKLVLWLKRSRWRGLAGFSRGLCLIALMTASQFATAGPVRLFFERDVDGQAGNELAVVSYPTFADVIANTISNTQFSQVDVDPNYSVRGVTYDGSAYRIFFERDVDGQAGNELAVVSYTTLADFVGNTVSVTQFSQIDIDPSFSIGGVTYDATGYHVLFERDIDGQAGNELALVSYASLADLIGNTTSVTQFTQIDVDPNYSVGGFAFDSGVNLYRVLFERNVDGQAGNDLAMVSYASLAALVGNTTSFTQFTQIDVDPNFSVGGMLIEADDVVGNTVDEPGTLALLATMLLLWASRRRMGSAVRLGRGRR